MALTLYCASTECSRPCTAEEEGAYLPEACSNPIDYCRHEQTLTRPRTIFCSIAFRDCLSVLPQDLCEIDKDSYIFDETTKQCKSLRPPSKGLGLGLRLPFLTISIPTSTEAETSAQFYKCFKSVKLVEDAVKFLDSVQACVTTSKGLVKVRVPKI